MNNNKPVAFRRVKGRIIPIFSKENLKQGAAIGAGAGVATYVAGKYPTPIKKVAFALGRGAKYLAKAAPLPVKAAAAGAAIGAASTVKLQNEKGEPVKLKISGKQADIVKRAALAGAGAVTAVKFGQWAGGSTIKMAQALNLAKNANNIHKGLPLFEAAKVAKQTEYLKAAKNIAKSREALIATGAVGGALLLHEAFKKGKTEKKSVDLKSKAIGLAAPALVAAGYYKRLNPSLKGKELIKIAVEKAFKFKRG